MKFELNATHDEWQFKIEHHFYQFITDQWCNTHIEEQIKVDHTLFKFIMKRVLFTIKSTRQLPHFDYLWRNFLQKLEKD